LHWCWFAWHWQLAISLLKPKKQLAKESNGNDAEKTNEMHRKLPECAQRNKGGTYKFAGGCGWG